MRTLAEFRVALAEAMRKLGDKPSLDQVRAAIRDLQSGGVPQGASFEGLLLQLSLAEMRSGWTEDHHR